MQVSLLGALVIQRIRNRFWDQQLVVYRNDRFVKSCTSEASWRAPPRPTAVNGQQEPGVREVREDREPATVSAERKELARSGLRQPMQQVYECPGATGDVGMVWAWQGRSRDAEKNVKTVSGPEAHVITIRTHKVLSTQMLSWGRGPCNTLI